MPDFEPTLRTGRCVLRPIHRDDAEHVWTASRHPGFTDGMLWDPPESLDEIHRYTDEALAKWGTHYSWTIEAADGGNFLGRIVLRKNEEKGVWNIGYWLHPQAWGQGYMTEAVHEVLRFAFEDLAALSVLSGHFPWNEKSKKVLLRAGFRHTGESYDKVFKNGKPVHELEYQITRAEFLRQE